MGGGYPPPAQLGPSARRAVRLWNSCYLWLSDELRRRRETRPTVLPSESRIWKWALFLVGNLVTVAGVVYEIAELDVCFDEKTHVAEDDDDTPEENAENALNYTMIMFVVGLWVDVFSAVSLSAVYRYPLDIKSAHLIPPGDVRNARMKAIVDFLVPFSWGTVYFLGGLVSMMHGENSACGGGAGGSGLADYLFTSGSFMMLFGLFLLVMSAFVAKAACCPARTPPPGVGPKDGAPREECACTTWTRNSLGKYLLSAGWALDLGWQVHGAILSYRVGAVSLTTAVLVGLFGGLGELLAALGSMAPQEVQELAGPVAM